VAVEGAAQLGDGVGQRVVEVAVAAVAEAMAGHVDRRAEAPAFEQVGQLVRLVAIQQRRGDGVGLVVELLAQRVPVERIDPFTEAGCVAVVTFVKRPAPLRVSTGLPRPGDSTRVAR
jgi:hypothetical protein